jgi:hypothetical protein
LPEALAICAIVRDEAPYLEEWIAYHSLAGVACFEIHDDASSDGTAALLDRLSRHVRLRHTKVAGDADYGWTQRRAYAAGARALAGQVAFVAFIDVDEFLVSRAGRSLPEELAAFGADVGAIAVGQLVFGSCFRRLRSRDPVTARFTRRAADDHEEHAWFKTIVRPECVAEVDSAHSVRLAGGRYVHSDGAPLSRHDDHPGHGAHFSGGSLVLHHYMVKSEEEFRAKQAKWAARGRGAHYGDFYFNARQQSCNRVADDRLRGLRSGLRRLIETWR